MTVETSLTNGQSLTLTGLGDEAVRESLARIRTSMIHTGYKFPNRAITINLSPANKKKEGSSYDLPISIAILADLQTNAAPVPALCGTSETTTFPVHLSTNLHVHATFAIPPSPDQIPSADWLSSYGLTNRPPVAEAALDPDRDGLLTWQEAALRSDPTDPASAPLRLTLLPPTGTDTAYRAVWHAYTNPSATYLLQTATNPLAPYLPLHALPAAPPIMTSPPLPPAPSFHSLLYRP